MIRNGLLWPDAPADYSPYKTIFNRFIRLSGMGVFNRIFASLAAKAGKPDRLMIDATHLKVHRTAASLSKKGLFPDISAAPRVASTQADCLQPARFGRLRLVRKIAYGIGSERKGETMAASFSVDERRQYFAYCVQLFGGTIQA